MAFREKLKRKKSEKGGIDLPFLLLVLLLLCFGLVMLYSASFATAHFNEGNAGYFLFRQLGFATVGLIAMFVIAFWVDYHLLARFAKLILIVALAMLVLVLFIGRGLYGEKRWFYLGFNFQPSEFAKFAIIVFFAFWGTKYATKMHTFRYGVLPFGAVLVAIAILMVMEPHYSGAIIMLALGVIIMFAAGTHWRYFVGLIGLAAVGIFAALKMNLPFLKGYFNERMRIWRDPWVDPRDKGYQIIQSLYAVGSGGPFGLGLGNSRQKFLYLPEAQNDFIFAIACEELGFVGASIIILLFILLIGRGFWIAINAKDRFGSLLVTGIMTLIALQTFLNIAVVSNSLPVTGASLPFFSSGGTALVITLAEMGVVLNVSRQLRNK